ncbi:MAG: FAD-dependent oxidoreductase, partial [Treponema sp.]|nr:FAD-dependent oxidoreductase [Treponema sp.]
VRQCENLRVPYTAPLDMMGLADLTAIGLQLIPVGLAMQKYRKCDLNDLSDRFKHPLLKKAFKDYLPGDYLASIMMNAYASIANGGGGVPDGGSFKVAQRMVAIYKKLGGVCHANAPVKEILLEDSPKGNGKKRAAGILLESGEKVFGDFVIPSCDTHYTFEKLLDKKYMPPRLKFAYDHPEAHKNGSTFHVVYECSTPAHEIGRRTYFDCRPFEIAGVTHSRLNMKNYNLDPINAPEGKALIEVKILEKEPQFLYWKNLRETDKAAYDAAKQKASDDILERLLERVPSLKGKLSYLDAWTPYTYTRYCNSYMGNFMTFITTKNSSNLFNVKGTIKELENVVLAGQWLSMPGGLPMAMTSGKFAVQRILRSLGKSIKIEP